MTLTLGQFRVGTSFNPSADPSVDAIKAAAAALIDIINALPSQDSEQARLKALAITAIEDGAMWGVEAATKQPVPEHLKQPFPTVANEVAPAQIKLTDPFEVACRTVAVSVMGSIGPWPKAPEPWQEMDMLDLLAKRGFSGVLISDVYETLNKIRGQK